MTNIQWAAKSISGKRKSINDDSWGVLAAGRNKCNNLKEQGEHSLENDDIVLAVSDGMGGGNAGHLASQLILEKMASLIPKTIEMAAQGFYPDYMENLENKMEEVHQMINLKGKESESLKGMGATLSMAWFTPGNMYLAHIGDSRLYRHRNGETELLTQDHSLVWQQLRRKEINEYQYRQHPRRAALYEVIGGGHPKINPQISSHDYQKEDQFILCSDGIIDGVWENNIHLAFKRNSDSTNALATSLIERAVENAGQDDTTIIAFQCI